MRTKLALFFLVVSTLHSYAAGGFIIRSNHNAGCASTNDTVQMTVKTVIGANVANGSYTISYQNGANGFNVQTFGTVVVSGGVITSGATLGPATIITSNPAAGATDSEVNRDFYVNSNGNFGGLQVHRVRYTQRVAFESGVCPNPAAKVNQDSLEITLGTPANYSFVLNVSNGCGTLDCSTGICVSKADGDKVYQLVTHGVTLLAQTVIGSANPKIPTQKVLTVTDTNAVEGAAWTWLENGATILSGTESQVTTENSGTVNDRKVCTAPPPTPTPAATATATATPTATATAAPSRAPTVPPTTPPPTTASTPHTVTTGGYNSQSVYVANPQDIYKPIVDAINGTDDTQPIAQPTIDPNFVTGAQPSPVTNNKSPDLQKALGDAQAEAQVVSNRGLIKLNTLQPINFPTVSGSTCEWPVTLPILGSFTVSAGGANAGTVTLFRNLVLMFMLIGAWFTSVGVIRKAIS